MPGADDVLNAFLAEQGIAVLTPTASSEIVEVDTPIPAVTGDAQHLSSEELRASRAPACAIGARGLLDSFDIDGDGSLDIDELGFAFQQLGLNLSAYDLNALRNRFDADGNGQLNKDEFLHLVEQFLGFPGDN